MESSFFIHLQLLVILIALSRGVGQQFWEWMVISLLFPPSDLIFLTTRLDRISRSGYSSFLSVCTVFPADQTLVEECLTAVLRRKDTSV